MHGIGFVLKPIFYILRIVFRVSKRLILFPQYSFCVLLRIRLSHLFASARGVFLLLFTNRYVFHVVLLLISLVTIASQLQPKNATAFDAGQRSMLYTLVTDGRDEVVEETVRPETIAKNANYLGSTTLVALPSVDYDYENDAGQALADSNVPGTIVAQPGVDNIGAPSESVIVNRTETEMYTVKSGDTVASIAQSFGVNVGTITWANKLDARASIKPGDTLKIPPVSGVLHVIKKGDTVEKIAKLYQADADKIYEINHLTTNHVLAVGDELVIPGGTPPAPPRVTPKPPVALRPNVPISRIPGKALDQYQELSAKDDTRLKPPDEEVKTAAKLIWPSVQRLINQYYGWQHTGVDINGDYTDAIYAAADGVVETAGWNSGGYGLMVMIDHQNGYKTRYSHASKLFVKDGDVVKQGQVIGMVGTTGRSTGTHLHFEVYVNGKRANPLAYVKP